MLDEIDKISIIEPSIDAAKDKWAKFQIEVYERTENILSQKGLVIFAPSLVLDNAETFRTRPDTLILWGEDKRIRGIIAINATVKYHLDDLKERVIKLEKLREYSHCPSNVSELFYKKPHMYYQCPDCSRCSRPIFIPIIVTETPYEGTSYCLIDKSVHLMDFRTYTDLIKSFDTIVEQDYPIQYIINTFKPTKCPTCGNPLTLSTVWRCDYTDECFADKCDATYEWIDGGHYNHEECCGEQCPSFHRHWCEDLIERNYAFFCLRCEKVFDEKMEEIKFCSECISRFSSI